MAIKKTDRFQSIRKVMKHYEREPQHARQVARLALRLFDDLTLLHGLGELEREWLEAAALLHDIGWSRSNAEHHKESGRLILKADLIGWLDEERQVIANIARYHRKAAPKETHKSFAALSETAQTVVAKLAAILRIADGLDRSHHNVVESVTCRIDHDVVRLELFCRREIGFELFGFEKKRDLFHGAFGLEVVIDGIRDAAKVDAAAERRDV